MAGKPKFKPEITRIRLNPEQAVVMCACYNLGRQYGVTTCLKTGTSCDMEGKATISQAYVAGAVSS